MKGANLYAELIKIGEANYTSKSGRFRIYHPYHGLPEENDPWHTVHWVVIDNMDGARFTFKTLREIKDWLTFNKLDQ
jgi:hypothetical protein